MTTRDFVSALREADAGWKDAAQGPAAARLDAKLRARLEGTAPRRWGPVAVFAAAFVLGLVVVWLLRPSAPVDVGGFTVARAAAVEEQGEVHVVADAARLTDASRGLRVTAKANARLKREARGVRLVSGSGTFEVNKVPAGAGPVRVLVHGADIEVRGTRFVVEQRDDGSGSVTLEEGRIMLRYASGAIRVLSPGETARWPERTAVDEAFDVPSAYDQAFDAPAPEGPDDVLAPLELLPDGGRRPARGAANPANWTEFDRRLRSENTLKKVLALRESGQWHECVQVLEQALRLGDEAYGPGARERLSWELGAVLTWQIKDVPAACWQWKLHERAWPRGRYAHEVSLAKQSLGCKP